MADDNVQVKFGADIGPLQEGTSNASSVIDRVTSSWTARFQSMFNSVSESAKGMTSNVAAQAQASTEKLEGFNKTIEKVHKTMSLLAEVAVLGFIGDKIMDMAKKTAEYAHEVELAAQKTGMNTDALQGWGVAATMAGGSSQTMLLGIRKLSQEIVHAQEGSKEATAAFTKMGMSVDELKGMKMEDVMLKVADAFKSHANGAEKAALAQQLFGRAGQNLIPILNMGREGIAQMMKVAQDAGAVMSKEDVEGAASFKQQLELLHITTEGLEHRIGVGLMPSLVSLTRAFQNSAKTGGQLAEVMNIIPSAANLVAKTVSYLAEGFQQLGARIAAVGATMYALFPGNLAGARDIWFKEFNKNFEEIAKKAEEFRASLDKPFKLPPILSSGGAEDEEGGRPSFATTAPKAAKQKKEKADSSRVSAWRDELQQKLEAEENYFKDSKEEELAFWEAKLAITKAGTKEQQEVSSQIYQLKKQMAIEANKDETEGIRANIDEYKALGLLEIDIEAEKVKQKKAMGEIDDAQEIAALLALENQKYAIEQNYLNDLKALYSDEPKEQAKINAQIEELAKKHQLAMLKISRPVSAKDDPMADIFTKTLDQMGSLSIKMFDTIAQHNRNMGQTLKSDWNKMVLDFANMTVTMAAKWVWKEYLQTAATSAQNALRKAMGMASAVEDQVTTSTTNVAKTESATAAAAMGAAAAVAPTPYVGPALAVAAAAAMEAMGQGYVAQAAAAGGYDIPAGVNPVTQLHSQEMVLPAHLAEGVRGMVAGGRSAGGNMTMNVHAIDSRSFQQYLSGPGRKALSGMIRNFSFAR
jgi:hypothetical protein